jgi:hypothetical protein
VGPLDLLGVDVVCPVDGVSVDVDLIGVKEVDVKGFVGVGVGVDVESCDVVGGMTGVMA